MLIGPLIGQGERPLPNGIAGGRFARWWVSVPHLRGESIRLLELADVSGVNRVDLSAPTGRYERHQARNWKEMEFKRLLKIGCVAALVAFLFVGLGPAAWQPRSGIGWQVDHFAGYFVLTLMFCVAWPRPFLVGGGLIVFAALLEALQAIPPDRDSNIFAVIYSAAGVLAAALIADLFIRARRQFQAKRVETPKP